MTDSDDPSALDVVRGVQLGGRACVITGATSGLGRVSAMALASAGARVVLAGRSAEALEETRRWIVDEVPDADVHATVLDLASIRSVRRAAEEIGRLAPAVDLLMNNAGVMFTPFSRTEDGFELQLGVNHLGHFELTRLLESRLVAAEGARVVILSSGGHVMGDVDFDDPNWEARAYDKFVAYGASKTANLLHMVALDRRLRDHGVSVFAVNPGAVATSLARHMSREDFSSLRKYARETTAAKGDPTDGLLDFRMPDQGAATQVWAAVSPALEGTSAVYLEDCQISSDVQAYAVDAGHAERLWELSERMCSGVGGGA